MGLSRALLFEVWGRERERERERRRASLFDKDGNAIDGAEDKVEVLKIARP